MKPYSLKQVENRCVLFEIHVNSHNLTEIRFSVNKEDGIYSVIGANTEKALLKAADIIKGLEYICKVRGIKLKDYVSQVKQGQLRRS